MRATVTQDLDSAGRGQELQNRIQSKPALRMLYEEAYARYQACLQQCPGHGVALELGSGGGFAKEVIPELTTSDVIPYEGVDQVLDATAMPYDDGALKFIGMLNVFHHIPDAEAFLLEAQRCLTPQGRLLILDQNRGPIATPLLKYVHHEDYDASVESWKFESEGPLSDANGALAWVVFKRDWPYRQSAFPKLRLEKYEPHTPLRYWLAGGLKTWSLLPTWAFGAATQLDRALVRIHPSLGSFVAIELVRVA